MFIWLSRIVSSVFSLKFFAGGLMMAILGVVLYNIIVEVVQETLNFGIAQISGVSSSGISSPSISGFAGWFLANIKVPETFAVIVTCVALKFVLRKIPFLNW